MEEGPGTIEGYKQLMSLEQYDREVMKLQEMVAALESQTDLFERKEKLTPDIAKDLLGQIDDVHEQLQKLDDDLFGHPTESRERKSLVHMMDQLRARLVKSAYARAAFHLTEPQRREMRGYVARLSALTRESRPPLAERIRLTVARAERTSSKLADDVLKAR